MIYRGHAIGAAVVYLGYIENFANPLRLEVWLMGPDGAEPAWEILLGTAEPPRQLSCRRFHQKRPRGADSTIETAASSLMMAFVGRFASHLRFKAFRRASLRPPPAHFHRKRKKLTATEGEWILAQAEILRLSIESLLKSVDMQASKKGAPEIDPDQYAGKVAPIAAAVRQAWMLPRRLPLHP